MRFSSIVKVLAATTCLSGISAGGAIAASNNLLINGDFATGDLTGWTLTAPVTRFAPFVQVTTGFGFACPTNPSHCFYTKDGTNGYSLDLSQGFQSRAGSHLTIQFQFGQQIRLPGQSDTFSVALDGNVLQTFTNTSFVQDQLVILHAISTGHDTLDFNFVEKQGGGANLIGNVSVSAPEPVSWALMIAGFGLVGVALRRRAPITA